MDSYYESSRRGSSYRGSSFRGASSRGSRGATRGSSFPYRDTGKYSSSSHPSRDDYYSRRTERADPSSYGTREREHRSEIADVASRKRERNDSYQGVSRRPHEEEYRTSSSTRYSGGSSSYPVERESRHYESEREFKKPRVQEYREFKPDYKSEHRVKEPMRVPRGRSTIRGGLSSRARGISSYSRRGSSSLSRSHRGGTAGSSRPATTSEILAIRRAKLLQKRLKDESAAADGKEAAKKDDAEGTAKDSSEKTDEASSSPVKEQLTTASGRPFMKLECPACSLKCITFREYGVHLTGPVHIKAMKAKSDELKANLAAMRISQREKQKQIEADDLESLSTETLFCPICKLNYSQEKSVHEKSDMHKKMKEFLLPICKICHIKFQSSLYYQDHLCSLHHLKSKHVAEERAKRTESSGLLDRFMVLDSVGSGDEADDKEDEKAKAKEDSEADNLQLGIEFIHEVKAMYCEVCCMYMPRSRSGDYSVILKAHTRSRDHLQSYLRYGNDELLEKINSAHGDAKDKSENAEADGSEEPLDDNKLWDGLSEVLDEAQTAVKSDDEDEEEGGRFDRINSKEKNANGETIASDEISSQEEATAIKVEADVAVAATT